LILAYWLSTTLSFLYTFPPSNLPPKKGRNEEEIIKGEAGPEWLESKVEA